MKDHPYSVLAIDTDQFLHNLIHEWKKSKSYNAISSKIISKMDIEGSEFIVLPHILVHGSLCHLDSLLIEWHDRFAAGKDVHKIRDMISTAKTYSTGCTYEFSDVDDESYMDSNFPLPNGNRTLLTIKRSI